MLSVTISSSRYLSLAIAGTLIIDYLIKNYNDGQSYGMGSWIFPWLLFSIIMFPLITNLRIPLLNYFETPMPATLELIMPYLLGGILGYMSPELIPTLMIVALFYSIAVFYALFPGENSDIDGRAADNFWSGRFN